MNRAVFLDRDGTINEDVGNLSSTEKLTFIPDALRARSLLQEKFQLFIITNQSGIDKGIFSEEDFLVLNRYFLNFLKKRGIFIKKLYYCPHKKERRCVCHKPNPYFLRQAEKDYAIDLKKSYVVGDHPHDIEMAQKVKAKSVYVLTGHGQKHKQELTAKPDFLAADLFEAALWIMKDYKFI